MLFVPAQSTGTLPRRATGVNGPVNESGIKAVVTRLRAVLLGAVAREV